MTSISERDDLERRLTVMLSDRAAAVEVHSDPDAVLDQPFNAGGRHSRRRSMLLAAAATIVVLTIGLLTVAALEERGRVQTDTVPPTTAPSTNPGTPSPRLPVDSSHATLPATTPPPIDSASVATAPPPATGETPTPAASAPPLSISPSGGWIALTADSRAGAALTALISHAKAETDPLPMDIYVTRESEPTRRLIATNANERCPAFSPDGQRLAYLVTSGTPSIMVVRLNAAIDPSEPEFRLNLPASGVYATKFGVVPCPQWSPDGRHLAYFAYRVNVSLPLDPRRSDEADLAELRVATLDGQEQVINAGSPAYAGGQFAWSPDGDAIAYATGNEVWAAPLDGSAPYLMWATDGKPMSVAWSSRGELAVTVQTIGPSEQVSRETMSVHVIDIETGAERMRDVLYVYDLVAAWSPDGSQLAYVGDDQHIVLNDRDDDTTVSLSPPEQDLHPFVDVAWSSDGQRLLGLARSETDGFGLISLSPDGASADVITPWTWAMDLTNFGDVSWQPAAN